MSAIGEFFASLAGKILLAAVVVLLVLFGVRQCNNSRQARAEASLNENMSKAHAESGADAVGAVSAVSGRNSASDNLTRENADAIRNAAGATAPVDPAVHGAGLDSLCRRAAYSRDLRCLQLPGAPGMADAGAGRAAAGD